MERDKLGKFLTGKHASPKTEFKKGEHLGNDNPRWKGGRYKKNGYWWIYAPNHPRAYKNKMPEHIVIVEKKLGRYLNKGEIVHHINRIKDDNRIENLIVFKNNSEHIIHHHIKYERIFSKPLPLPNKLGRIISIVSENNKTYIIKKCNKCNKLFWTRKHSGKINQFKRCYH